MSCTELRAQRTALRYQIDDKKKQKRDYDTNAKEVQNRQEKARWEKKANEAAKELATLTHQLQQLVADITAGCTSADDVELTGVSITFLTHEWEKAAGTLVHVFVKNRASDSSTSLHESDYISNQLSWDRYKQARDTERNPYLASAEAIGQHTSFGVHSSHSFDLNLRYTSIMKDEVVLPVVDVHILGASELPFSSWAFSWSVELRFSDGETLTATSDIEGVQGIVLDSSHRNYTGLGVERGPVVPLTTPTGDAMLISVEVAFATHAAKQAATMVDVRLANRLGPNHLQMIAAAADVLPGVEFGDGSTHMVTFGPNQLPLADPVLALHDVMLPMVFVHVVDTPVTGDLTTRLWGFDHEVRYHFSDGRTFTSRTDGVVLTRQHHTHAAAYRGDPFPSVAPPGRPDLSARPVLVRRKTIPLGYLRSRLDQFVNHRQSTYGQDAALRRIRLHNSGFHDFGVTPESYLDVQSLVAEPVSPGVITGPDYAEGVTWRSKPTSLGQLPSGVYFDDASSTSITITVNGASPTPIEVTVTFDPGETELSAPILVDKKLSGLSVRLRLTLTRVRGGGVDLMSWIDDIEAILKSAVPLAPNRARVSGTLLGGAFSRDLNVPVPVVPDYLRPILIDPLVHVVANPYATITGIFQQRMRLKIYDMLRTPDPISGLSPRDSINATVTSLLVGDTLATEFTDGSTLTDLTVDADQIVIEYTGPRNHFEPPMPPGWPTSADLSPAGLQNIDHLVVVTMENRSFDHMLGYLSLPRARGGDGRTDVDGLVGGESNPLDGAIVESFAFAAGETVFAPDPPHRHAPVSKAINGGLMDGFVRSYAELSGTTVGPRVMGHHTAANLPIFDALARDFAIGDRWFAAHPGPTFANRFYELTGHLDVDHDGFWVYDNASAIHPSFTSTIFDHLSDAGVSWTYYEHEYCFLRLFERYTFDSDHVRPYQDPALGFRAVARSGGLPSVTFIDPHFIELPPGANCDGPPADIRAGQTLLEEVVDAVITSPQWPKTMLVIVYDEHGGFYDHVPPPPAVPVSPESLDTYGVRVPAIVVSPWVAPGSVFGHDSSGTTADLVFDHTSILKTIVRRFLNADPPAMGARYAAANDLSAVITPMPRPGPFRPFIPYRFSFGGPQTALAAVGDQPTAGVAVQLVTSAPDPAPAFCLEYAATGSFHIRTRTGGLYLTAQPDLTIRLATKPPHGSAADPAQRWHFAANSISITDSNKYDISNLAFPGLFLQSTGNSAGPTAAVFLGPHPGFGPLRHDRWTVSSPLLPDIGGLPR